MYLRARQVKAASSAFKDVAIYAPPPMCVVRTRIRFHDRNAAARGGGTTPPAHVLYRCRRAVHLCAGIATEGRSTAEPRPDSALLCICQGSAHGLRLVVRCRRSLAVSERVFHTHGGASVVAQQVDAVTRAGTAVRS